MGLHCHLNDVSSDSIPLLLIALIANCVSYLRSSLLGLLHSMGLSRFGSAQIDSNFLGSMGSGLASLVVLTEQLNLNRIVSYRYFNGGGGGGGGSDCVVCLCTLRDGDHVSELDCRHVFHKVCFDGWLDHLNFSCPLCRVPFVSDERVKLTGRRVGGDLVTWFNLQR
ncbi:zf-RING_2 domain-containing protein [Cephalotus follicularis]|uniref:Zf-RING_2 domain-containing protein n=1 Tax=Cephalotus follicularis TaxID=3775 RepID=A0A1Q3BCH3_CEPFO|nr:zf-RING_2 domain-containing protein [Cephalotus follicularis]